MRQVTYHFIVMNFCMALTILGLLIEMPLESICVMAMFTIMAQNYFIHELKK